MEHVTYLADLHVHSHYSRATSDTCRPGPLAQAAARKGLAAIGTGDFTHAGWRAELGAELVEAEEGFYRLRTAAGPEARVRFVVTGEISCIYKQGGRTRKIHHLVLLPNLDAAARVSAALEARGANLEADGRPIIGIDSRTLLAIILEVEPAAVLVPAHIWTPHFSLFGANSGFDALEECFGDLAGEIAAYETGLSSDPPMNWRLSALDRLTLISNSDAHSPDKLGREANEFEAPFSYRGMVAALRRQEGRVVGTVEFYPEEGKYHYDGHRNCGVCWHPEETLAAKGICRVCGRPVTVGVLHRVADLADRPEGFRPPGANMYTSLVSLDEIVADALGVGAASKRVRETSTRLVDALGPEISLLREADLDGIATVAGTVVAEAVRRVRAGEIEYRPGYDGEYGKLTIFRPEERRQLSGQAALFALPRLLATDGAIAGAGAGAGAGDRARGTRHPERPERPGPERPERPGGTTACTGDPLEAAGAPAPVAGAAAQAMAAQAMAQAPAHAKVEVEVGDHAAEQVAQAALAAPAARAAADPLQRRPSLASLLDGLNPAQQRAVTATAGPVIVTAGPGTGKTRTLIQRIVFLLQKGVRPEAITAITFTHRAADEMRRRLVSAVGAEAGGVRVGTFHRFCLDLLTEVRGTPPLVLDAREASALAAEAVAAARVVRAVQTMRAAGIAEAISRAKSQGLRPEDPGVPAALAEPYQCYQQRLAAAGACDYDDLLLSALDLIQNDTTARQMARKWAAHLLVDEFQDVNPVQYQLVKALAGDGANLFVIGDPDQAIYGFRGADHRFFAQLAADFPSAASFHLTLNYRSTSTIVRAANAVIGGANASAAAEQERQPGGQQLRYIAAEGPQAEARAVVREIERLVGGIGMLAADRQSGKGMARTFSLGEIAVLFRTGRQAEPIEEALLSEGIPYRTLGWRAFVAAPEVREALDILRYIDRPTDLRFMIALRGTRFDPGAEALALLARSGLDPAEHEDGAARPRISAATTARSRQPQEDAGAVPRSRLEAATRELLGAGRLTGDGRARIQGFLDLVAELDVVAKSATAAELLLRAAGPRGTVSRALRQVARAAGDRSLAEFMFRLATGQEADHERREDLARPGEEGINLLTMHAAKGLEFPVVVLVGLAEGIVPWKDAAEDAADGDALAEERRLFYVALTRAAEVLVLIGPPGAPAGRSPAQSRFVREIPGELVEFVEYGGGKAKRRRIEQQRLF
ncbi:MAG: UvrD-helicase domain-containing protein [Bacteroidota bacterium]